MGRKWQQQRSDAACGVVIVLWRVMRVAIDLKIVEGVRTHPVYI